MGVGRSAGSLLGVPAKNVTADVIDFREQSGIYVLYSDYKVIYVGQCGLGKQKLFIRLKQHRTDDLAERWDRFSWFGIRRVLGNGRLSKEKLAVHPSLTNVLNHIEGVLIHAVEPAMNSQKGRFGNRVKRYLQIRDGRLGPTTDKMLQLLCEENEVDLKAL
ncbi:MAG TPA: hypothetical protein VJV21_06200 [Pyrinomonadaceae bacterium]|nr:hypothetical protein [Pyrinomonadaceae bacterium]